MGSTTAKEKYACDGYFGSIKHKRSVVLSVAWGGATHSDRFCFVLHMDAASFLEVLDEASFEVSFFDVSRERPCVPGGSPQPSRLVFASSSFLGGGTGGGSDACGSPSLPSHPAVIAAAAGGSASRPSSSVTLMFLVVSRDRVAVRRSHLIRGIVAQTTAGASSPVVTGRHGGAKSARALVDWPIGMLTSVSLGDDAQLFLDCSTSGCLRVVLSTASKARVAHKLLSLVMAADRGMLPNVVEAPSLATPGAAIPRSPLRDAPTSPLVQVMLQESTSPVAPAARPLFDSFGRFSRRAHQSEVSLPMASRATREKQQPSQPARLDVELATLMYRAEADLRRQAFEQAQLLERGAEELTARTLTAIMRRRRGGGADDD